MNAYIKAQSYHLPETVVTDDMLVGEFPEWTVEKAASKVGVSRRHVARPDEFASDLAVTAAENLIVRTGGMRHPQKADDLTFDSAGNPHSSDCLFMAGAEIFGSVLEAVPPLVASVLQRNDLALSDIDLFVFHQANRYMMEFLRKKIGISPERFYYSLENTGNTVPSTIPLALCEARKEHRLQGKILLAGFGVGYSWGATVLDVKP